jgi:hypothetical protein
LPLPVDRHSGRLILDPGPDELEAYEAFPLQPERIETATGRATGWLDRIPGCLREKRGGQTICSSMLLDTGGSGFYVISNLADYFSVAYDAVKGVIGLKVRPTFGSSADAKSR